MYVSSTVSSHGGPFGEQNEQVAIQKRKWFEIVAIFKFNDLCIPYTKMFVTLLDKCLIQNFKITRACVPLDITICWVYVELPHE